jgi:hypothetical protein
VWFFDVAQINTLHCRSSASILIFYVLGVAVKSAATQGRNHHYPVLPMDDWLTALRQSEG